jgi:hypothetical protein
MEMQLAKLIRRKIVVLGPKLLDGNNKDEAKLETVTLVGVEASGIWIESEEAANRIADKFRVKPASPSAFFIPFAQIVTILASNDATDAGDTPNTVTEKAA